MKHIISKLLLISVFTWGLTNRATALDFTFSFSNTGGGGIDGTVTGRILGLTDNATSVPTAVFVDSAPDDFEDVGDFNFLSIFLTTELGPNNTFTVEDGQIIERRFFAEGRVGSIGRDVILDISEWSRC